MPGEELPGSYLSVFRARDRPVFFGLIRARDLPVREIVTFD